MSTSSTRKPWPWIGLVPVLLLGAYMVQSNLPWRFPDASLFESSQTPPRVLLMPPPPIHAEYPPGTELPPSVRKCPPVPTTPDKPPVLRIALLLVGGMRTFAEPRCHLSLLENYIKPLRAQGADVRQFWHLSLEEASSWIDPSRTGLDQYVDGAQEKLGSLATVIDALDPEAVTFYDAARKAFPGVETRVKKKGNKNSGKPQVVGNRDCPGKEHATLSGFYPQYHAQGEAFQSLVEHEKECGGTFDWVIRIRPDLMWVEPIGSDFVESLAALPSHAANNFFSDKNWKIEFGDLVFAMPRPSAGVFYASMPQVFGRVPCDATRDILINAESGLQLSLEEMGFASAEMDVGTYSISRPDHQECKWNRQGKNACCKMGFLLLGKVPMGCSEKKGADWRKFQLSGQALIG